VKDVHFLAPLFKRIRCENRSIICDQGVRSEILKMALRTFFFADRTDELHSHVFFSYGSLTFGYVLDECEIIFC